MKAKGSERAREILEDGFIETKDKQNFNSMSMTKR
jgi:hypothetical protein